MNQFNYSKRAKTDLRNIGQYTLRNWGEIQADQYLTQVEDFCRFLAETPHIGRVFSRQRPGLRRMEWREHVIFYRQTQEGVLITRILHRSMLPDNHTLDEK